MLATIEIIGNDTTALSTHVLPTKDQVERADVTLWDFLLPRVAAQHTPPIVEPVGDRRSTWWVVAELGRRLGFDLAPTSGELATDESRLETIARGARCTFDELIGTGWVETDYELPARWVDEHLDRLGGWRLASQLLVEQLAALATPASLVLVPRRQARHLNSQFDFLGEKLEVIVHPDDATAARIVDGEAVAVASAGGVVVGIAKFDPSMRRGAVSVPHGHQGANVNLLTGSDDIDRATGMAHYSGIPVTIRSASAE